MAQSQQISLAEREENFKHAENALRDAGEEWIDARVRGEDMERVDGNLSFALREWRKADQKLGQARKREAGR